MKKFLTSNLILLIIAGSFMVRDARAGLDNFFYVLTSFFFIFNFLIIFFGKKWTKGLNRFQAIKIRRWVGFASITGGLILLYPILISYYKTHDMYVSVAAPVKFMPLLFYPIFSFAIRGQREWYRFFIFIQILAGISAGLDIYNYYRLSSIEYIIRYADASTVQRDFVFGLLLFLMFVIFFDLPKRTYWCLFLAAILCTWRTILLGSRGPVIVIVAVACYSMFVVFKIFGIKLFSKKIFGVGIIIILLSITTTNIFGTLIDKYFVLFQHRFAHTEGSTMYRITEIEEVWENHLSLIGMGWGSEGNFGHATTYTTGRGSGILIKSGIHNLYLYLVWKLGAVGLLLIVLFFIFCWRQWKKIARKRDKIGFVVFGLLIAWAMWSSVNMIWANPSLNLMVASWLGYFLSRQIWQNENFYLSTSKRPKSALQKGNMYNAVNAES